MFNNLEQGINYVSVEAQDMAFNATTIVDAFRIYKDTVPPTVPALILPANSAILTNINPLLGWSTSTDATSGVNNYTVQVSTDPINFTPLVYSNTLSVSQSTITPSINSDVYYWRVQAQDVAGNYSAYSSTYSIMIDTIPPVIVNNTAPDYVWHASSGQVYSVNFYDPLSNLNHPLSMLTTAYYKIFTSTGMSGIQITPWTPINTQIISSTSYATNWQLRSSDWNLLQNGTNYVSVRADDLAGNTSWWTDAFFVRKDTVPPSVPLLTSPTNGTYQSSSTVTFAWAQAIDINSGINSYDIYVSTSQLFGVYSSSANTTQNSQSIALASQGAFYWQVRAKDNAGNYSVWSSTSLVLIDTSPPAIPLLVSPSSNTITNATQFTFNWSDSYGGGAGLEYYVFNMSTSPYFTNLSASALPTTSYYTLPGSLTSGIYYWRVMAQDNAGWYSLWSSTYSVMVDTTAPAISNFEAGGDHTWRNAIEPGGYNVDFAKANLATLNNIEYSVYSQPAQGGTAVINWTTVTSTYSPYSPAFVPPLNQYFYTLNFGVNFNLLANGTNYISVMASDLAGNTSTWIDAFVILKDVTPPTLTNLVSGDYAWRNSSGTLYNVQLNDTGSGLSKFQIMISTSNTAAPLLGWF